MLRRILALLFSLILVVTGMSVVPATANAQIQGVTVSIQDAEGTTGNNGTIVFKASANCASVSCGSNFQLKIQRPPNLAPDAALTVASSARVTIDDPKSPEPTITFNGFVSGQNDFSLKWTVGDNPSYPADNQLEWTATVNGQTQTGSVRSTITGLLDNQLTKGANQQSSGLNGYTLYTLQYIRRGTTGVTGTLVDQLPPGTELVAISNPEGEEAQVDPRTGDVTNFSAVIPRDNYNLLAKKYITYDEQSRQIRINVDKNVDNVLSRPEIQRFRVSYILKHTEAPANGSDSWINTYGWAPDGLQNLAGQSIPKTTSGLGTDQTWKVKYQNSQGDVAKNAAPGTKDLARDVVGNVNEFKTYYTISVKNGSNGPVTLTDTLRKQTCVNWTDRTYQSTQCSETDAQADGGVYFYPDSLNVPSVINERTVTGADGQPVKEAFSGFPEMTITFSDAQGRTEERYFPAEESGLSTVTRNFDLPADFNPNKMVIQVPLLLAGQNLGMRLNGYPRLPESIFELDSSPDGDNRNLVYIPNDLQATYKGAKNEDVTATVAALLPVRPAYPYPLHNLSVSPKSFVTGSERLVVSIDPRNDAESMGASYSPFGVVALPAGFTLTTPLQTADNLAQRCIDSQKDRIPADSGLVPFDPRQVTWKKVSSDSHLENGVLVPPAHTSPSGGEVWVWTVPENMVLPEKTTADNGCAFTITGAYDGAATGTYNNYDLASQFPKLYSTITTADPNQKTIAYTDTNQAVLKNNNNPFKLGCVGEYAALCERQDFAWFPRYADLQVMSYGASTIKKFAVGDKDPADQLPTTFLPTDDNRQDVSYATDKVTWMIQAGASGSNPVKDYVLYDALPAEQWVKMSEYSGTQEEMAGTHPEYDEKGNITNPNVTNTSTLIPTLSGPIQLPVMSYWDPATQTRVTGPAPAEVWYSTSADPCRPELSAKNTAFPTAECSAFDSVSGQWWTADQKPADVNWDQVRYFRVKFTKPLIGTVNIPFEMTMPRNNVDQSGITDEDIAINRVANRAWSNDDEPRDLGTIKPAVARVKYVPEVQVNKSVIIPADGETFEDAQIKFDGRDPGNYLVGEGDFVYFQISVSTKNDAVLASPVIRDFIPNGMKFIEAIEPTVGQVYTDYNSDLINQLPARESWGDGTNSSVVWVPGKLTKDGVEDNGTVTEATVTLKLQIVDGVAGTTTNYVSGGSNSYIGNDNCVARDKAQIDADVDKDDDTRPSSYGCDSQSITIAPKISGSLFNLGNTTQAGITDSTPKVTDLQEGDIVAMLLDQDGQPVLVDGQPLTVPVKADGTYVFPKVAPGDYQVRFQVKDDPAVRAKFEETYFFAQADANGTAVQEPNLIDGVPAADSLFLATTPVFTVPGRNADGGIDAAAMKNVPNVDFAVVQVNRAITLTKTADEQTPRELGAPANFTITGSNTGNVALGSVVLTDSWAASHPDARFVCSITNAAGEDVTAQRGDITTSPGGRLEVNDTYTCAVTYTVTQADIDGQSPLTNEASITGSHAGVEVSATGTAQYVVADAAPDFTVTKTVNGAENAVLDKDGVARFTIAIENTGNVTLKNVAVSDVFTETMNNEQPVALVCGANADTLDPAQGAENTLSIAAIPPNTTWYCVGEYTASQAFVDAQQRQTNVAAVVPSYLKRNDDGSVVLTELEAKNDDATVEPTPAKPVLNAAKQVQAVDGSWVAQREGSLASGGNHTYRITVSNTGNVAITGITVTDTLTGRDDKETLTVGECVDAADGRVLGDGSSLSLAPGQTAYCAAGVTYTQADVDAQRDLVNTITVEGSAQVIGADGNPETQQVSDEDDSDNAATLTPPAAVPALSLNKRTDVEAGRTLLQGDTVTYSFDVANTGNVSLHNVVITDPRIREITCNGSTDPLSLQVGEEVTCTGTYVVTADDVSSDTSAPKALVNTATVNAQDPRNNPVPPVEASVSVPTGAPRLDIVKQAAAASEGADLKALKAGDEVTYQIRVTNNGTAALADGKVTDQMLADRGVTDLVCTVPGKPTTNGFETLGVLEPGETAICEATVEITQDDVDQSVTITNTAVASGRDANNNATNTPTASAEVETIEQAGLELVKSSAKLNGVTAELVEGDKVTYTLSVRNTGFVTLKDVTVSDATLTDRGVNLNCPVRDLAPGESFECTTDELTVTAEDVANGSLVNQASYTSTLPSSAFAITPPQGDSNEVTDPVTAPAIALEKKLDPENGGPYRVGDTITYTFTVRNTGKTQLTGVTLSDPMIAERLQATPATASALECVELPGLTTQAGATMDAGTSTTCRATVTVTQADVDAGVELVNTATVEGGTRNAPKVTADSEAKAPLAQDSQLQLAKSIVDQKPLYVVGDTVTYQFVVTNTGQRTIRDITIDDQMLTAANAAITCEAKLTAPGLGANESGTCTAEYTITEDDAAAGESVNTITNVASAKGTNPGGEPVESDPASATLNAGSAELAITKGSRIVSGGTDNGEVKNGSVVEWAITVTNGGTAPAQGVVVSDEQFAGARNIACYPNLNAADAAAGVRPDGDGVQPDRVGTIPVGESVTCFAQTTITQADVDGGNDTINTASASVEVPNSAVDGGAPQRDTTATVSATVPTATKAGISLVKDVTPATAKDLYVAGDKIVYSFTVTNTGFVTLSDIAVSDPMFADQAIVCDSTTLAPGESTTCTSPVHVVTAAEAAVDGGTLLNKAQVTGVTPAERSNLTDGSTGEPITPGGSVTDDADKTVPVATPQLSLTKTVTPADNVTAGTDLTYTLVATNTGDAPLNNVVIRDPWFAATDLVCDQAGAASEPGVTLAAKGDSVTCTVHKIVTQDEVDRGEALTNTATATGSSNGTPVESTDPSDNESVVPVQAEADATVTVSSKAALTLDKQIVDKRDLYAEGDTVSYSFTVTNTGDVTLHDITVIDPMLGDEAIACVTTTLAPKQATTCGPKDLVVDADQAASGSVDNTAFVTALTPQQDSTVEQADRLRAQDTESFATGIPALAITKVTDVAEGVAVKAGDVIGYTITVTNTGNTPATNVKIDDKMLAAPTISDLVCSDMAIVGDGAGATLAQGAAVTCTFKRPVTADDVAAFDNIANTAGVSGEFGAKKVTPVTVTATTPVASEPKISLVKKVTDPQAVYTAGDTVTYTFTVKNEGTVPLTDIVINDELLAARGIAVTCEDTSLAVGASTTCTSGELTVSEADVAAGVINNVATVTASVPTRAISNEDAREGVPTPPVTSDKSEAEVPTGTPVLAITKQADTVTAQVGDIVTYTIVVTNTGTTPVENMWITDDQIEARGGTLTCDDAAFRQGKGTLAIGESATCKSVETMTPEKLAQGTVTNTAATSGNFHKVEAQPVSATATVTLAVREQGLATKLFVGNPSTGSEANGVGDGNTDDSAVRLPYNTETPVTVTATNSGQAPLTGVTVAVDGVDFSGQAVNLTDAQGNPVAAPTVASGPVAGLVVRQAADGSLVVSDDDTLPALILEPGQTISVTQKVPGQTLPLVERNVTTTATNTATGAAISATDPLYITVDRDKSLAVKIYGDSVATQDGQSPETSVDVEADLPFNAGITLTNNGGVELTGVTVTVPGANLDQAVFTLTGADGAALSNDQITVSDTPVTGKVLRVTADGTVVLSEDTNLKAVVLEVGQSATARIDVDAAQIGLNTPVEATAYDPVTGDTVDARDDYYTKAIATKPSDPAAIDGKIYITVPDESVDGKGDGQTPDNAVKIAPGTEVTATITISNPNPVPLTAITVEVTGATLKEGTEFTITDGNGNPVVPTAGATGPGLVLRVTADGKVILSSDATLPMLVLQPGQRVVGKVRFTPTWNNPTNVSLRTTARTTDSEVAAEDVDDADSLYTVVAKPTVLPLPDGSAGSSSDIPWWVILVPAVAVIPAILPAPAPVPAPAPAPAPAPQVPPASQQPAPQETAPTRESLLAQTGASVITLGIVALLLLLAGVGLIAWRRRREDEQE